MGLDLHNLHLLAHAQDLGVRFERTIGIGRQAVFLDAPELARFSALRGLPALVDKGEAAGREARYFEPLMQQWFGARTVDSVDASAYESASLVHDMNLPWPAGSEALGSYDAVLDFGCLEHVFDFPTAWKNCVDLCRVGGHVLHSLPANNLTGHGFYQFSPELFFSLYRPERGFDLCGLWLALKADRRYWWQVADPRQVQRRVTLANAHETYLLVLARKLASTRELAAPQQSDYAQQAWVEADADPQARHQSGRSRVAGMLGALGLRDTARRARERLRVSRSLRAPDYRRVVVADLLRGSRGGA